VALFLGGVNPPFGQALPLPTAVPRGKTHGQITFRELADQHQILPPRQVPAGRRPSLGSRALRMSTAQVHNPEAIPPSGAQEQIAAGEDRPLTSDPGRVLSIEGLGRRFGSHEVIESLTLSVQAGERVALRGPNGSGKTTVLRCVVGTVAPTRGNISVAGYPVGSVDARGLIGASLSQERSFYLRLSGHANLLCFARLRLASEAEAVEQVGALEQELAIEDFASRPADTYSAGMLQQLAFARALDRRPNAAIVVATHNRDDLGHCGDRIELPT
jgi:ABC-2 type transport system ATP-binding protein